MDQLVAAVRAAAGEGKATRLRRSVEAGRVALDKAALAPCFELVDRSVAPFDLGFELKALPDGRQALARVKPGSAAARAGAQEDDIVVMLDYRPDRPDVPVEATVLRAGRETKLRFLPAGKARLGKAFVRAARAPRSCDVR